jgi:hypothetical protein
MLVLKMIMGHKYSVCGQNEIGNIEWDITHCVQQLTLSFEGLASSIYAIAIQAWPSDTVWSWTFETEHAITTPYGDFYVIYYSEAA